MGSLCGRGVNKVFSSKFRVAPDMTCDNLDFFHNFHPKRWVKSMWKRNPVHSGANLRASKNCKPRKAWKKSSFSYPHLQNIKLKWNDLDRKMLSLCTNIVRIFYNIENCSRTFSDYKNFIIFIRKFFLCFSFHWEIYYSSKLLCVHLRVRGLMKT